MAIIDKGEFINSKIMSNAVKGKTIERIIDYSRIDDYLAIIFTDGTSLEIRYDYIYDWTLVDHKIQLAGE